jgi:hypothetical protein
LCRNPTTPPAGNLDIAYGSRADRAPTTCDARHSEGNYQSYIEDLKRRKDADADQPHRIAYKKLVRA